MNDIIYISMHILYTEEGLKVQKKKKVNSNGQKE